MKIEKCPFCGCKAILCSTGNHFATEKFFVSCGVCGVETPRIARTRKEAIAAWNRRAQPENKPLTLDELRGMYSEPLYVKSLLDGQIFGALIHNQNAAAYVMCGVRYDTFENYGKTWLAYRHKPERSEG